MRLDNVSHGHKLKHKLLLKFIRVVSRHRVPDVVKTLLYRGDFFGTQFSELVQSTLRGDHAWTVGERELFASFTSRLEACHF